MNVSKNRSDRSRCFARRLGSPSAWVEMLQQELIHAVVQRIGLHHLYGELSGIWADGALGTRHLSCARHGIPLRFGVFHILKMPPYSLGYQL
jgi:hypothetical protein